MKFFSYKKIEMIGKMIDKKGFTILETLVAISILVVAITAAFSAVQTGISSSIQSKNQVTAFFLANEAVEYIRNTRDSNVLAGSNWLSGLAQNPSDECYFGKSCIVDAVKSVTYPPDDCQTPSNCPNIRQDGNSSSQTYDMYGNNPSWSSTIFNRKVELKSINSNEIAVLVTVSWTKGGNTRDVRVRELVLNWQ